MTPQEQKVLTQALEANRRALSLLDKRMYDLSRTDPSVLQDFDVEDKLPFFYSAVGADGQPGIPFTTANIGENPAFGFVRMQPDSAFVLTQVHAAQQQIASGFTDVPTVPMRGLGLRFYDESSSRWITFTNQNNEPQQKATIPSESFSPLKSYSTGGFALPAECVFPRSGVIRVEVYVVNASFASALPTRAFVVFGGYKIFGG